MIGLSRISGWNVRGVGTGAALPGSSLARRPGHEKDTPQNSKREQRGRHRLSKPVLFCHIFTSDRKDPLNRFRRLLPQPYCPPGTLWEPGPCPYD